MKFKKLYKKIIKLAIIIASYGFIIIKLYRYKEIDNIVEQFSQFNYYNLFIFIIVLLLMVANWSIESVKWRILVKHLEIISFLTSLKAVLSGVTVSIFTPNRVGEFGGRIFVLRKKNRVPAIFATIVGSFSQLIITIAVGIISLILFFILFPEKVIDIKYNNHIFIILLVLISAFVIYIYFNIDKFSKYIIRLPYIKTI